MKWLLVKQAVGAKRSKGNLGLECFATNSIPRAISHIFSINIMINRGCTLSVIEVKSFWIQIGLIQLKLRLDVIWGVHFGVWGWQGLGYIFMDRFLVNGKLSPIGSCILSNSVGFFHDKIRW